MKRIALAAIVATALLGGAAMPAEAATAGGVVFVGQANTGGLYGPVSNDPGCTPVCPRRNVGWSFSSIAAVGAAAGTGNADAGLASITGSGSLEGWCGQSFGSGGGSASVGASSVGYSISWVSGGTLLVLTGTASNGAESGPIVAVVDAVPPNPVLGGGSCLSGTATQFTIVGAAAFATA